MSLDGLWETEHPGLGTVYVRFATSGSEIEYEGMTYEAWEVSLWRLPEGSMPLSAVAAGRGNVVGADSADGSDVAADAGLRKVRDGLFGSWIAAAVVPGDFGPEILWRSREESDQFNPIVRTEAGRTISLGAPGHGTASQHVEAVLTRVSAGDELERAVADLPGIYRYYHTVTGNVYVRFAVTDQSISVGRDREIPAYAVSTLFRVGDLGYCPAREGLFGGSFPNDTYPLVGLDTDEEGLWLVWQNPAARRRTMRTRIVSLYANGDIGIGLERGDARYVEDTVFRRIAGADARVASNDELIPILGRWTVTRGEEEVAVRIEPTTLALPGEPEVPLYLLTSIDPDSGEPLHAGLYPGDPFALVSVVSREGSGRLLWYSPADDASEEDLIFDPTEEEFLLMGGHSGSRYDLLRFHRLRADASRQESSTAAAIRLPTTADIPSAIEEAKRRVHDTLPAELTNQERMQLDGIDVAGMADNLVPFSITGSAEESVLPVDHVQASLAVELYEALVRRAERALVEELAVSFYRSLPAGTRSEWNRFALWNESAVGTARADNVNPAGFASGRGMLSPSLDFATFVVDYYLPPPYRDPMLGIRQRLPGRYAFVENLLGPAPGEAAGPLLDSVVAETPRDWIDAAQVESIELIVTTPTATAPESLAGHLHLLIRRYGDYVDGRDSLALSFVGVTSRDVANGVGGLAYVWRGLTGRYLSAIQEETFHDVVERGTLLEDRDIQHYRLELSRDEIERFIQRLWVIKHTSTYQYRFFGHNCASMLIDTLNHSLDPERRVEITSLIVPPVYVVAMLQRYGVLTDPVYPEYWSVAKAARAAATRNREIEERLIGLFTPLVQEAALPGAVLDELNRLVDLARAPTAVSTAVDPLFREPIAAAGSSARCWAYRGLATMMIDLRQRYVGPGRPISIGAFDELASLLLHYYTNAFGVELFLAVPDLSRVSVPDAVMTADVQAEQMEEYLSEVQRRERNSPEINELREAQSRFRLFLADTGTGEWIYSVGREVQDECTERIACANDALGRSVGYFPAELESGLTIGVPVGSGAMPAGGALAVTTLGFRVGLFDEQIGHDSLWALKRDMRFRLLMAGMSVNVGLGGSPSEWGLGRYSLTLHGVVVEFRKIVTGRQVNYSGVLNHGYAFTVLDGAFSVTDEALTATGIPANGLSAAGISAHVRGAELDYLVNLFEVDQFRSYANIAVGAAYTFDWANGAATHRFGIPVEFEAKVGTGTSGETALRGEISYEPMVNLALDASSEFSATLGFEWASGRNPQLRRNIIVEAGWEGPGAWADPAGVQIRSRFTLRW